MSQRPDRQLGRDSTLILFTYRLVALYTQLFDTIKGKKDKIPIHNLLTATSKLSVYRVSLIGSKVLDARRHKSTVQGARLAGCEG